MHTTLGIHFYIVTLTRDNGHIRTVRTCSTTSDDALTAVQNAELCPRRIMSARLATRGEIAEIYGDCFGADLLQANAEAVERNTEAMSERYETVEHDGAYYVINKETLAMNDQVVA